MDDDFVFEYLEQLTVFTSNREFLSDVDEPFRLKHVDEDFSTIAILSSAFLIEKADRMGRPTDWVLTDEGNYLLERIPGGVNVTEDELEGVNSVGLDFWRLPPSATEPWRWREIEAEAPDRSIGSLHDAGLIKCERAPIGHPNWWTTTERADEIREIPGLVLDV